MADRDADCPPPPGELATSADCGSARFCSQATDINGCFPGVQGAAFFCRSCNEECSTDSDCASMGAGAYCTFIGLNGRRWGCALPTKCAG